MSWLFGMKAQEAPMPPQFSGPAAGGGNNPEGGNAPPSQPQKVAGGKRAYSSDSTALERAAKAARDLEQFSNAKEALELSRLQEVTRQKEVDQQTKQLEAQVQDVKSDIQRFAEEFHLARKRAEEELAIKARVQEESLRKQEKSVIKQEVLSKATIENELALKHKYDLEKAEAQTKAQAKAAHENRDVNMEQLRAHEEEHRMTAVDKFRALITHSPPSITGPRKNVDLFPKTTDQLLERLSVPGGEFLMAHEQFDASKLMNCLNDLKIENLRLEEQVEKLQKRRAHLLAVNNDLQLQLFEGG